MDCLIYVEFSDKQHVLMAMTSCFCAVLNKSEFPLILSVLVTWVEPEKEKQAFGT